MADLLTATPPLPKALFEAALSHPTPVESCITKKEADRLFSFFQTSTLFRWGHAQNDCEDRANAICMLLDSWGVPNYKGWVFSGAFLKKTTGSLLHFWNYHVAAALPVAEAGTVTLYIIDPATANTLITLENWADRVTSDECSYYMVRRNDEYIFHHATISETNWHKRNRQNYKWTMQGLAGINGVTRTGKAQLVFAKSKIKNTEGAFKKLFGKRPV
ncbi:MAG TPA: protein-glutamine glutaminase family protein [Chitinophagaceae bacterium]|nr:protein-glutamine glutaminase family protein [Chitinophagaceae bacterium]